MGPFVQILQERHRELEQRPLRRGAHAELEQTPREAVPVWGLLQQPMMHQIPGDAVHGALGQSGAPGELGEGKLRVGVTEGTEDEDRLAQHGVELSILIGHEISVPVSGTKGSGIARHHCDTRWVNQMNQMKQPAADLASSVTEAAARLRRAAADREPCAPVRDLIGAADVEIAYAVQQEVNRPRIEAGARVVGRKIGLTAVAVQQQLGVDQPDFGVLFDDMEYASGAVVADARLLQPKVEGEIAFVLGADLADGDLDLTQVADAVDHAVAAIEVVDSRIAAWDISFADTVADNASAGGFVLGDITKDLGSFVPRDAVMTMTVTGEEAVAGTGSACLGDPLVALQWLARQSRQLGQPLLAGQVILSGALGPMRQVAPGSTAVVEIEGLGTVSVSFSEEL